MLNGIIFLGDVDIFAGNILHERYGDYMKSDIVQVSHHGFNGASAQVYDCISAKVALFPTRQSSFNENLHREANQKVLQLSEEVYIAGNGMTSFKLPYELGTAKVYPKEINK